MTSTKMWWKLFLLSLYLVLLFILSRILEAVAYYEGGYLASRLLDPVSLSVRRLKTLLDQRGVSYAGVVERHELTELVDASGEVTEGELEAATLSTDDSTSSTNFTCGSHFYEEVEDTKDSVWVVQVLHSPGHSFMKSKDWKEFIHRVSRFGVRTGIFDCSQDWRYCNQKKWYSSRLVLALPQGYRAKDNVIISNYMGPCKVESVMNWVSYNLASRIKQIEDYNELHRDWYSFDAKSRSQTKLRIVLFSTLNIPPMFYSVLSVKYTGRVQFGNVDLKTEAGKSISRRLNLKKVPLFKVIMPEKNYTFGSKGGEYLNYDSMTLFLKMLHPEVNDLFLLSLIVVNVTCWLEFFITLGPVFRRLFSMLWHIGKWNCLLILLWLPLLGLFQLPYMDQVLESALKALRLFGSSSLGACVRYDWLSYTTACSVLGATFLLFAITVGILHYVYQDPEQSDSPTASSQAEWLSLQWDTYMSYLFQPVATLTRPMNTQDMDLEVGMELLIERLAVPNFWLRPMISSDYIKDLPVWKYTGPCIDSDIGSDTDCTRVESDGEEFGYRSDSSTGQLDLSKKPLMFYCERCRALQNNNENRTKTAQELEQERRESESACAKFLMDGDYKCQCQMSSTDIATRRSPKKERYKRSVGGQGQGQAEGQDEVGGHSEVRGQDDEVGDLASMPPGMLDCTECSICLESYKFCNVLCGLPCGHSFHQQCIMGWMTRDNHCCPVCRWPAYKAKPCSLHLHAE